MHGCERCIRIFCYSLNYIYCLHAASSYSYIAIDQESHTAGTQTITYFSGAQLNQWEARLMRLVCLW